MKAKIAQLFGKHYSIPKSKQINTIVASFSFTERLIFGMFFLGLSISALALVGQVNTFFSVAVPVKGGTVTEGVIGSPRFINPLLALSDADRDLTQLIYSGLMKATPEGGLIPDIAESVTIAEDHLSYTFILRDDVVFHDGRRVTADDVVFTITRAQDQALRSPKRANWEGVVAEKISDRVVRILLSQPYAPFLENATLGILPKHIWQNAGAEEFQFSQYNIEPIGSGPYKIKKIRRNASGVPDTYSLASFKDYALGAPYISNLNISFYTNEQALIEAYQNKKIAHINSILPEHAVTLIEENLNTVGITVPLPRIFGVFFNQNQAPLFADQSVREALEVSVDREHIVEEVLKGFGEPLNQPIPPGILALLNGEENGDHAYDPEKAIELLEDNGWELNPETGIREKEKGGEVLRLSFSLSTSNVPELKAVATILKEAWDAIGASVEIKVFDTSDLNQNVIRPRRYDALLFGEIIGRDLDFFAFWHSSQRNDPGLNIALYANITTDKLLEDARITFDPEARARKYQEFNEEIQNDTPAVFLYVPHFIYLVSPGTQNISLGHLTIPSERFLNVHEWYTNTEKVWKIFVK